MHADLIHLKRADGNGIDALLHVEPDATKCKERALLVVFNQNPHVAVNTTLRETAVAGGDRNGGERRWRANSQLQQISPLGELRGQLVSACTGDPANYNQLTHELQACTLCGKIKVQCICCTYVRTSATLKSLK